METDAIDKEDMEKTLTYIGELVTFLLQKTLGDNVLYSLTVANGNNLHYISNTPREVGAVLVNQTLENLEKRIEQEKNTLWREQ